MIKYEKDIVRLRKAIQAQQKAAELAKAEARHAAEWKWRVLSQGPWDEGRDPLPLTGAPALPMPVTIRYVTWDDISSRLCSYGNDILTLYTVIRRAWRPFSNI